VVVIAASIGVLLLVSILGPFFWGPGGLLQEASSINSPVRLEALKHAILKRYLEDESSFSQGHLSQLAWDKRRHFLVNRYIDTARRLDFVAGQELEAESKTLSQGGAL
jgi:hypothetical protein